MHTYVHCGTFTIAKAGTQPKCPLMIDWTWKTWHIYTMEYYAATKNDEFLSFLGTWMNLETFIHSKQHKNRKSNRACSHSQMGVEQWEHMDTGRGALHTEVCCGGLGEGQWEGEMGRDSLGRNAGCRWWGGGTNYHGISVPMQQSCKIFTCTPWNTMQL